MAQTKVKLISDGVIDVNHLASGHSITTDNIGEGSNLYYTDARVSTYLSTNNYATEGYVTTEVAKLVNSAPTTLDTLNELAAALGDDPNFATTVSNSIAMKLPLAGGELTGTLIASGAINMNNTNITAVNHIIFNDAGVDEGIEWAGGNGWKIYESPDNLTNAGGNLQFVTGSTRRMTLNTSGGLDVTGNATVGGTLTSSLISIEATAPILDFVDTNSFTDVNDRFRIRAAGDVGQIRWWDDSASTDSVLTTFYPDGNVGVSGQITSSGGRLTVLDAAGNTPKIVFQEAIDDDAFTIEYNGVGSGAGNYVSFYSTVTGWAGLGTGLNYIPQNGRVGIGTIDPQTSLHLTDALTISDVGGTNDVTLIQFTESDNYDQFAIKGDFAGTGTENKIKFTTDHGGGDILTLTGGGDVGIGNNSPSAKLHVGTAALSANGGLPSIIGSDGISCGSGSRISVDTGYYTHGYMQFSGATWGSESAYGLYGYYGISLNTRSGSGLVVRGDSNNVGIGVTSPAYKLDVRNAGNLFYGQTTLNNSTSIFRLRGESGVTDLFEVHANGNIGIGTSTPYTNLYVQGAAPYITIANTTEDDGGILFTDYQAGANPLSSNSQAAAIKFNSSTNEFAFFNNDIDAKRMAIDSSGNIGAPSGSNIYNASDERLKKNITPITNGLSIISDLNPVKFNWIEGFSESEKDKTMLGFIAQQVQQVLPEAVEDFSNSTIVAGDKIVENPLRVNEKFIIPILVKSIQELKAEIDSLKQQLNG